VDRVANFLCRLLQPNTSKWPQDPPQFSLASVTFVSCLSQARPALLIPRWPAKTQTMPGTMGPMSTPRLANGSRASCFSLLDLEGTIRCLMGVLRDFRALEGRGRSKLASWAFRRKVLLRLNPAASQLLVRFIQLAMGSLDELSGPNVAFAFHSRSLSSS
jgi:hypothetical protein